MLSGTVKEVQLAGGSTDQMALVEYGTPTEAQTALKLNGMKIGDAHTLQVSTWTHGSHGTAHASHHVYTCAFESVAAATVLFASAARDLPHTFRQLCGVVGEG